MTHEIGHGRDRAEGDAGTLERGSALVMTPLAELCLDMGVEHRAVANPR